jgi:hypothetical protein
MKRSFIYRLSFLILFGLGMGFSQESKAGPYGGVSFQVFYNELSPYGDWIMDPTYGYVWVPYAEQGFHPYGTNGYWEMTNFGNTWVSNYEWGWAPFHYGRWFWNDFYGWAWVPGYEWGPAWVNWRTGGGYYGWAPLSPGLQVNVAFNLPTNYWVFIPQRRFRARNFYRYCAPAYHVSHIYNRTTFINNTYVYNNTTYNTGPSRREIERSTRTVVPVYQVSDSSKPGRAVVQNDRLNVYRPEVRNVRSRDENPRPSRVFTADEYKARAINGSRSGSSRGIQNESGQQTVRQASPARENSRNIRVNPNAGVNKNSSPSRNVQNRNRSFEQPEPNIQNRSNSNPNREERSRYSSPSIDNRNTRSGQDVQSPKPNVSRSMENANRQVERTRQQTNQRMQQEIRKPATNRSNSQTVSPRTETRSRSIPESRTNSGSRSSSSSRSGGRGGN